jgi:hypothetical protein
MTLCHRNVIIRLGEDICRGHTRDKTLLTVLLSWYTGAATKEHAVRKWRKSDDATVVLRCEGFVVSRGSYSIMYQSYRMNMDVSVEL